MIGGWVAGVDVSSHQRPSKCDWDRAKEAGVDFAFVRLTIGADVEDKAADEHMERLDCTTLPFGVYHFCHPDFRFDVHGMTDGREAGRVEAEHLLEVYHREHLHQHYNPIAIDYEKRAKNATDEMRADYLRSMVEIITADLGRPPIIYTGDDVWRSQMPRGFAEELRGLGCALWLATYTYAAEPVTSEVIPGWPWSIWQHSGGGKAAFADPIPGMPNPVDQNRYRGSKAELRGIFGV